MELKKCFIFNKKIHYIPFIFIFLIIFYVFQYYYVEENFSSVVWAKFSDLKRKQNFSFSLLNYYNNPKPIQTGWESKEREKNCSKPFVSVSFGGRLGNQICEFFTLYLFKIEFRIRTVVSSKMFKSLRRIFETVPLPHLPDPCFKTETESKYSNRFENIYRKFKSNVIDDKNTLNFTNIANYTHISCCPCPVENLWSYRQNIHSVLKFKKKNVNTAKHVIENALKTRKLNKSGLVLVGTHVRRSDYLRFTRKRNLRYPSVEFYLNAFNFFRLKCKNVIFIVVSDDMKWCEDNLSAPDVIFAGNGNQKNAKVDFTLLTLCDHHIRGLGTFGYTSAFLGKGSAVIFRERKLKEKPILTLEELSKSNFTCDSTSQLYLVDE
ncbi:UNVERIFIED_CONTAM: hypothetical protein RMT77_003851 [Armadillidium vulgare]